jgi:hypothetical protein
LILLLFVGLIGTLVFWQTSFRTVAAVCWGAALLLAVVYYGVPSTRRPMYVAWTAVMYPIGWIVAHALLALVYYGWITPVGLLMRLFGRDPMQRRSNREARSYWIRRKPITDMRRYFRQY